MSSFFRRIFTRKQRDFDIPENISPNVTELNLSRRNLKGTRGIERFKDLIKLNLSSNRLTFLSEGIGALTNLRELDLANTRLVTFPESFGNLINLVKLDLYGVRTITSLPESFGNLRSLLKLDLHDNKLTSLPQSIGNLTNLTELKLENNRLTSLPESIGNLRNLRTLYLFNNKLTSLPVSIRNLNQSIKIIVDDGIAIPNNLPVNMTILVRQRNGTFVDVGPKLHRAPAIRVDSHQIHKEAAKIDYDKLIDVLKNKTTGKGIDTNEMDYANFINTKIMEFIESSKDKSQGEKNKEGLNRIMTNRLFGFKYSELSRATKEYIFYVLEYVGLQSQAFKDAYVNTFISDCIHAYEGSDLDSMTCAAGALERILFSLQAAFASTRETEKDKQAEYDEISNIIANTKSKDALALEYIKEWYQLHKTGTPGAFPEGTPVEQKKANLTAYLTEKFPLPEDKPFIENQVQVAEDGLTFDDDAFTYGGRKRRTRKIRKARKARKGKSVKKQIKKSHKSKKQGKRSKKSHK